MLARFSNSRSERRLASALLILFIATAAAAGGSQRDAQEPVLPTSSEPASGKADVPQQEPPSNPPPSPPGLTPKQQRDLLKENFEKMKRQADELSSLAKSLREELDKSNENVLSLKIVEKADKIEKLAKKIRDAAKGY